MALEVTLPAEILREAVGYALTKDLGRTTPAKVSSSANYGPLLDAAVNRAAQIAPEASPLLVANREYVPQPDEKVDTTKAASMARATAKGGQDASVININPNVDASYYAHELGHAVSQKNKIGKFVSDARHKLNSNPKLGNALRYALGGGLAATAAGLQEGDDDLAGSIALAAAISSPTLVDEALASKNALAIMNDAGLRANMAQRGRLAGAYMSYLAPVLIAGSLGNAVGNAADDYTAVYDL